MNEARKYLLERVKASTDNFPFSKHNALVSFCVCAEFLLDPDKFDEIDFDEIIVIVDKNWLYNHIKKEGYNDTDTGKVTPLKYLREVYTSDDSYQWFEEAIHAGMLAMINFN